MDKPQKTGKSKTPRNTSEYIASFPKEVQGVLSKMRETIRKAAPDAEEAFAYRVPTFRMGGKNLVHFAAFTRHVGFYPTPSAMAAFEEELAGYTRAKGSVQFPLDQPIPFGLIRKMVLFRVGEMRKQGGA